MLTLPDKCNLKVIKYRLKGKNRRSGLKDFATEIWNGITDTTNTAGQMQVQNAQIQTQANIEMWNSIWQSAANAWENIQSKWSEASKLVHGNIYNPLENLAQSAGAGIAAGINSAIATIQSAWAGVVNWFKSNVFGPIGQNAVGFLEVRFVSCSECAQFR